MYFILSFFIGDLILQSCKALHDSVMLLFFALITLLIYLRIKNKFPYTIILIGILSGFLYTNYYAQHLLSWSLPKSLEGQPVRVQGYIVSLPIQENDNTRFIFNLSKMITKNDKQSPHVLINLTWRNNTTPLKVGDKWQLNLRLKCIHGIASPGAFNYEALALAKGIRASAYVVGNDNEFITHHWYIHPIDQLRQHVQIKLQTLLPPTDTAHWLEALIIGERENIKASDWEILRNTGTNHLMAIAGLHIGLITGFIHTLVSFIWRRIPLIALQLPAAEASAYAAIITAIAYSALAGFSLPTQRACIMLLTFMLIAISRRHVNPWKGWALALISVLLLNPLSVLSDSFWLSFYTLAIITYGLSARIAPSGWWWKWGRVQWVIGVGLIPLSIYLYQECSLISFAANCIAIPWLGFLILPLCLISTIFLFINASIAKFVLLIADKMLNGLWTVLTWFAHCHLANFHLAMVNQFILITSIIGFFFFLLPIGTPGRWLGIIWSLPLLFYPVSHPNKGNFWFSVLDVGQGLSVVVQTKHHVLLYDAGSRLDESHDMGVNVVIPFMLSNAIKKIDMLVVSHGDNDHIGGVNSVANVLQINKTKTSVPNKLPSLNADTCLAGQTWQWDGVKFSFLYPDKENLNLGNNSSCVLKIENDKQSLLLTGDIEKIAERELIGNQENLSITYLIAPHHGSKTSAVKAFTTATHPNVVIYSTGYRNRYHFPNASVIQTYNNLGATSQNTSDLGTITWRIENPIKNENFRELNVHYWNMLK